MSLLKELAVTGLFAANALGALGQNNQPHFPSPPKNNFLNSTQILVLAKSFHTDRLTPFNEWNPGIFIKNRIGGSKNNPLSVMEGVYYNSNYTITPTIGMLQEFKIGKASIGLLAGVAIYPRVQKDIVTSTEHYGMSLPKNERKHGCKKTYIPVGPYKYIEVCKTYRARGLKNKFNLIPALLATFSFNAYKGCGPYMTATYVPWRSGDKNGFGVFAFGALINPSLQPR